jgi:hypothetical protein
MAHFDSGLDEQKQVYHNSMPEAEIAEFRCVVETHE